MEAGTINQVKMKEKYKETTLGEWDSYKKQNYLARTL